MPTIFIDESGQFAKDGDNNYFIVASFTVTDPRVTYNSFRAWMRTKMPRIMRDQPEIKFSDKRINNKLRIETLNHMALMKIKIQYAYLNKSNIPNRFKYKETLKDGQLYLYIIQKTIEQFFPLNDLELRIFCDERHLKGISKKMFKQKLEDYFMVIMPPKSIIQVNMVISHDNPNIQIADWIAGALARYHNNKSLGDTYYEILKNNLVKEGMELFKDQWTYK